jgi:hypothetical protein
MRALVVILLVAFSTGCTDAEVSRLMAYGDPHHIRVFSGGVLIGEWTTTGAVINENRSDGYIFTDAATKQMVRVSGEVIITLARPAQPGAGFPTIPPLEPGQPALKPRDAKPGNPYR